MFNSLRSIFMLCAPLALVSCAGSYGSMEDVERFIQRRESCDHFRGELPEPTQKERLEEVIRKTNEFCAGTDAQLKLLRKRYANDPAVISRLSKFEDTIE